MAKKKLRRLPAMLRLFIGATTAAMIVACGNDNEPLPRTQKEMEQLLQTNDRLLHRDKEAVRICDSIIENTTDSNTFYDYYILKGRYCLQTQHPEDALGYAKRTKDYASRQPQSPRMEGLLALANNTEAGYNIMLRRNREQAKEIYITAYEHIMRSDLLTYAPDIAANLADAYIYLDDLPNAARWYRRAMLLVDSLKLPHEKDITLYMGLAQIYSALEDDASARHYYEMTDRSFDAMQPNMQTYFLNNYGNCHYFAKRYPEALATFLRLKKHLESIGAENTVGMAICMVNLADTYLNLNMTDSAQAYLDKAAPYFEANGVPEGIYYVNTIRIGIALENHDYATISRLLATESDTKEVGQTMKGIRSEYLQEFYVATGNYRQAYKELLRNMAAKDSLAHNRTMMRSAEIMMRFTEDTLRLHYQLDLKEKDAEVSRSHATVWLCVSMALLLSLALLAYYTVQRRRWLQTRMETMKLRLSNTRRRISPHFVFNLLNMRLGSASKEEADVLLKTARLIRSNLDMTARPTITMREEIDFIKEYVEIERKMLGDDFEFCLSVPPQDVQDNVMLPTMLTQILVENAIKHGLKNITGHKRLGLSISVDDTQTVVNVTDNGPGIDIRQTNGRPGRNGLHIIRQTMAITNHENRGSAKMRFSIRNNTDEQGNITGCMATLTIPRNIRFI